MRHLLLALTLLLGLAAPAAAQSRQDVAPFAGPGTPVVIGQGYDLPTKHYPKPRRINVQLPPGYDDPENKDRRYPVLYLLDGGAGWQDFAHIAGIVQLGGTWGISAPVILVGVESGDRKAEFTQPSSDPGEQKDFPTHGKAETFRQFLVQDLKPAVDAAYRTDGTDGLIGESLAALFVVDEFLTHPADFDRYIAISPSLWWDKQTLAKSAQARLAAPNQAPRTLWLSIADEGGTMQSGVDLVVAALKANPNTAVTWTYAPYPAEKHSTIYHPAATRAVREVFPAPKAP